METDDVSRAIVCFQHVERIKSELILAARMLDGIRRMSGDDLTGASKMLSIFLEGLEGEINIAYNVLRMSEFKRAGLKVREAINSTRHNLYDEAMQRISEAISAVTTGGQWALQLLKDKNLL